MPSPGSRKRDLLPVRLRHDVQEVFFSSNETVVMQVYDKLIHIDLNGTLVSQDNAKVRQVIENRASIIHESEARHSTDVLIESEEELYIQLRYNNVGQAKIVSQVTKESMRDQMISQFEKDKDFAKDQLTNTERGFLTTK